MGEGVRNTETRDGFVLEKIEKNVANYFLHKERRKRRSFVYIPNRKKIRLVVFFLILRKLKKASKESNPYEVFNDS